MTSIATESAVILLLLLANGVFAMAELALVSVRKVRLRQRSEAGDARATIALGLAEAPNQFLATVQVGITLVGVLAGAFGGATLAKTIAAWLIGVPVLAPYANALGVGAVVVGITYLSLIVGELVPKRLALGNPEGIALRVARPMQWLARAAGPAVRFLAGSTDLLMKLLPLRPAAEPVVSEDEVTLMVKEGARAGVFLQTESAMVERILRLDRVPVRDLMTPRAKIIWVNVNDPHEAIWHKIVVSGHTTFPVYEGNRDHVVGVVTVKAIYANLAAGVPIHVRDLMTPPLVVPATQMTHVLLETFKKTGRFFALVVDEFGSVVGLVTLHDVMEAILGDLASVDERLKPTAKRRDDGSWLVDGMLEVEDFERLVPSFALDPRPQRDYQTVGGFVVKQLGHVPTEGECFQRSGFSVEVIDMDGHRVDKILLIPFKPASGPVTSP